MPTPRANESRADWMERCMASAEARRDFPDQDQRAAFCASRWERSKDEGATMESKSIPFEAKVDAEQRTVQGYAATFDRDAVNDIIEPGAFRKTIQERGDRVKFLWQHSEIIGRATKLEEDSRGLRVEAMVSNTQLGSDALELMADGAVDQLSIGFSIPQGKSEIDRESGVRRITEVKLFEFSAVSFPANSEAMITAVKSLYDQARKQGTDVFGDSLTEIRSAIANLEALIGGSEPSSGKGDTPADDQPPSEGNDPRADEIEKALQSIRDDAQAWAINVATRET